MFQAKLILWPIFTWICWMKTADLLQKCVLQCCMNVNALCWKWIRAMHHATPPKQKSRFVKAIDWVFHTGWDCHVWSNLRFCQKHHNFCTLRIIWFGSNFASVWLKYVSNNVWRYFNLPVSAFATVALRSSNCKFTAKIHFTVEHFMLPLLTLAFEV